MTLQLALSPEVMYEKLIGLRSRDKYEEYKLIFEFQISIECRQKWDTTKSQMFFKPQPGDNKTLGSVVANHWPYINTPCKISTSLML